MLKRCSGCGEFKTAEDFNWKFKSRGKRDSYCRDCRAEYKQLHYALNKERYIRKARARTERLRAENYRELIAFLREHSCVDCGEDDPLVLEFDHLGKKSFGIGQALRHRPWSTIAEEIRKCEVVCANCHRRRTARRGGFARAAAVLDPPGEDLG